jgi:transcription elongation factor GreA-like protein
MNKLNALKSLRKGSFAIARIVSKKKPLKAFAQHDITKVVLCTVRTGIEYRNQKEVKESGKEVGSLPWGEWETYPYLITHKGNRYLRLYIGQSMKVIYFVDGVKVSANVAKQMLPKTKPSQKPLCITVKESGLVSLKQKGKEMING